MLAFASSSSVLVPLSVVSLLISWTAVLNITPTAHFLSFLIQSNFPCSFLFLRLVDKGLTLWKWLNSKTGWYQNHFLFFYWGYSLILQILFGFGGYLCSWHIIYVRGKYELQGVSCRRIILRQSVVFSKAFSILSISQDFCKAFYQRLLCEELLQKDGHSTFTLYPPCLRNWGMREEHTWIILNFLPWFSKHVLCWIFYHASFLNFMFYAFGLSGSLSIECTYFICIVCLWRVAGKGQGERRKRS